MTENFTRDHWAKDDPTHCEPGMTGGVETDRGTQIRCNNCHKWWFSKDPTPICTPIAISSIPESPQEGWIEEFRKRFLNCYPLEEFDKTGIALQEFIRTTIASELASYKKGLIDQIEKLDLSTMTMGGFRRAILALIKGE